MSTLTADQLIFIARQHLDDGRLSQAEDLCRLVLQSEPNRADALHLLGSATARAGRTEQAIALLRRAIAGDPHFIDAHVDLAQLLNAAGDAAAAMAVYRAALESRPQHVVARAGVGDLHRHRGDHNLAIAEYEAVLAVDQNLPEVHNNLGMSFAATKRIDDAIDAYRQAIALKPQLVNAHYNLANALRAQEKLADAISAYRRAIALRPDFAEAHNNLGDALEASGDITGAIAAYDESISFQPDKAEPRWNRSLAYLISGDYARGWPEYEWRHRRPTAVPRPLGPRWNGEDLTGRTIFLYAEQGIGDTLQFVRYVPMVAARGGRVIVECQPLLLRLLQKQSPSATLIAAGKPVPRYDVQCPLMSLPLVFGTRPDSIPNAVSYLSADPDLMQKWAETIGPHRERCRIGLVWAGNAEHQYDHNRSMQLRDLYSLAAIEDVELFSLQVGSASQQVRMSIGEIELFDHTASLTDFAETAALIANLDLVISVDTAVAHLAAAMGRPTWVMLACSPDWRWMRDRADSAWYPTVRLFRQKAAGDWSGVVAEVCDALTDRHASVPGL